MTIWLAKALTMPLWIQPTLASVHTFSKQSTFQEIQFARSINYMAFLHFSTFDNGLQALGMPCQPSIFRRNWHQHRVVFWVVCLLCGIRRTDDHPRRRQVHVPWNTPPTKRGPKLNVSSASGPHFLESKQRFFLEKEIWNENLVWFFVQS